MNFLRYAPLLLLAGIAAQPPAPGIGDAPLRAAQDAWRRGDDAAAKQLYAAAEERSPDPGGIAFNLGAIHFRNKEYRDAELQFQRALDDRDAPAERRAKAFYNRGSCLIHLGGLKAYRAAVADFERCLNLSKDDPELSRDAEHNLELAKLLWLEARAKSKDKPLPNERPPEDPPEAPPKPERPDRTERNSQDPSGANSGDPNSGDIDPVTGLPKADGATGTKKTVGGKGNLPVSGEWNGWRPENEAEAREYLKRLAARLAKDRRELIDQTAPPEQPHVKDW